jgi:hypothetical protein
MGKSNASDGTCTDVRLLKTRIGFGYLKENWEV